MSSVSVNQTKTSDFDNFLYGMALSNHAAFMSESWAEGTPVAKMITYPFRMVEHVIYLIFKVITIVAFIFVNIVLTLHYFEGLLSGRAEDVVTKREVRMKVGFFGIRRSRSRDLCGCWGNYLSPFSL